MPVRERPIRNSSRAGRSPSFAATARAAGRVRKAQTECPGRAATASATKEVPRPLPLAPGETATRMVSSWSSRIAKPS